MSNLQNLLDAHDDDINKSVTTCYPDDGTIVIGKTPEFTEPVIINSPCYSLPIYDEINELHTIKPDPYKELAELAKQTIYKVMREGEAKYPDNNFIDRPIGEHLRHAQDHLLNFKYAEIGTNLIEELEHALTRIGIIIKQLTQEPK